MTVPVRTVLALALDALTVAVSVTGEFWVTLVADADRVVVVFTADVFTVTSTELEEDALKVELPA